LATTDRAGGKKKDQSYYGSNGGHWEEVLGGNNPPHSHIDPFVSGQQAITPSLSHDDRLISQRASIPQCNYHQSAAA